MWSTLYDEEVRTGRLPGVADKVGYKGWSFGTGISLVYYLIRLTVSLVSRIQCIFGAGWLSDVTPNIPCTSIS